CLGICSMRPRKRWDEQVVAHLKKIGLGPGAVVELQYPDEDLWVYKESDEDDNEGMYVELMFNSIGAEKNPPTRFFVDDVIIFSEDLVLISLIGGTFLQENYFFPVNGFENTLVFDFALEKMANLKIIQPTSCDH